MVHPGVHDLNYLVARLHGRRSRIAEAERLDVLCRCHGVPELGRALYPNETFQAAGQLQRRLVEDWAGELRRIRWELTDAQAEFLDWVLCRLAVENVKVALRGVLNGVSPTVVQQHLIILPRDLGLNSGALATAKSLPEFIERLPEGPLRESLQGGSTRYREQTTPFFFEALLDRGYFRELLARTDGLPGDDRAAVMPIAQQETDIFHLMLVVRGRFLNDLNPELLIPLHADGTKISRRRFANMLHDPDLVTAVGRAIGRVVDSVPASVEPEGVEAMAWARLLRLANGAFRRNPLGFGAVAGYAVIRRIEVANLITLSEGIRADLPGDAVGAKVIPRRR
jgi:vacuolar-type H+-ATPase subunit C/Vma6